MNEFIHPNELRKKYEFIAKKIFGQNFLVHTPTLKTLSQKILELKPKSIIEVGPGPGSVSQFLADSVEKLVLVEKDNQFSELLKDLFSNRPQVEVHLADFLKFDLASILEKLPKPIFAVGNLPYNVSVSILKKLFDHREYFSDFFLMFQKEVAQRICASENQKAYGSLSLYAQFLSACKIILNLPPSAFDPRPKIDSAVVHFQIFPQSKNPNLKLENYEKLIQASFSQRRKTLLNCLCANHYFDASKEKAAAALIKWGFPEKVRAENLNLNDFIRLAEEIQNLEKD